MKADGYPVCRVEADVPSDTSSVTARLVIDETGTLRGRIVDANGEVPSDVRASFGPSGPNWIPDSSVAGRLDLDGTASFEKTLPPGGYRLHVVAGGQSVEYDVDVPANGVRDVLLTIGGNGD